MSSPGSLDPSLLPGLALALLACAGCVSVVAPNRAPPVEYTFTVRADKSWQNSGVSVKAFQVIACKAQGEWGDAGGQYGPDGNKAVYKNHLKVTAPAFALCMKTVNQTNSAFYVGAQTSVVAECGGQLLFRSNVSLPEKATGEMQVFFTVADDADHDGLSDYDEIAVWHTDPLNQDTDGDGISDRIEAQDQLDRRTD
ncbi:MAG: hypothetical protein HY343_09455 [Lentisphaerae bacterium]|nr:hypothetical protein [Lentisphaerota bacterium]